MRRRLLGVAHLLPPVILTALALLPVLTGDETFFLRDLFGAHLGLRHSVAEGLAAGHVPLLDVARPGQPLAGNPNAVAFHPTALLHLVAPLFVAFNAHLWLHLLAAPFALAWLARELGLGRRASWAAGVCFGLSGYLVSNLTFFNLIGGVVTAPALAAAVLATVRRVRAGAGGPAAVFAAVAGLLWALELLAGDPMTALMAAILALAVGTPSLLAGRRDPGARRRVWVAAGLLAAGLAAGTLVALPQIVEFLRILPASARSLGFLPRVRTAGSFDPRQALDWLLPFAFGRPDRLGPGSFWGMRYYQESWAFFFTLYPGLPAIALVAAAGWRLRHRVARVGWGLAASGVFLALGRFNPVAEWLFTRQALEVLRYPLKLWFFVAVGLSLLCGLGFERAVVAGDGEARRRATVTLAGLAALVIGLWAALRLAPVTMAAALLARMSASAPRAYGAFEVARWSGLALASAAVAAAAVGLLALARRRPGAAGAALLALHAGAQLLLLRPALATDATLPYRTPTRLLDALPAEELVVHGSDQGLFGPRTVMSGVFPAPEARWIYRRAAHEAYPTMAGQLFGRRYELNTSPEALDPVPTRRAVTAVENAASDGERLRLLAAWGVARLVVDREIAATDRRGLAEPVASAPSFRQRVWVYRLPGAAPEVYLATRLLPVSHDRRAAAVISGDGFRPGRDAVVVTAGPVVHSPGPHQVEVRSAGTEELSARVVAPGPALLVWQRAWSPLYRATVDGRPTPPVKANLYRLGVPVPGGEHEVRLWVDRRPLGVSLGAAAAGGAGLLALLAVGLGRLRRHPAGPPPGP